MISARTLACLESITALKNKSKYFGGLQMILSGDFYQLPPVQNISYHDTGNYCFEYEKFSHIFPHRVILEEIHRQNERDFITCIQEVSRGSISAESKIFISNLDRPLPVSDHETVQLFSTNEMADDFNRSGILAMEGQLYEYTSVDNGSEEHLSSLTVPKKLWLKLGIPVILLRNISDSLVNGLRGTVHAIDEVGPTVKFDGEKFVKLKKINFEGEYNMLQNKKWI